MNAATLNRFVKPAALIASAVIVGALATAGASLIHVQASPRSDMPVYELPRVVVTGHRVTSTDSNLAERAAAKPAVRG
jgi:hypothetical protein